VQDIKRFSSSLFEIPLGTVGFKTKRNLKTFLFEVEGHSLSLLNSEGRVGYPEEGFLGSG